MLADEFRIGDWLCPGVVVLLIFGPMLWYAAMRSIATGVRWGINLAREDEDRHKERLSRGVPDDPPRRFWFYSPPK